MARVGEYFVGRALLDDAAAFHHGDAVGELLHHRHFVGDEQDGEIEFGVDLLQQRQDLRGGLRIERRGRLVRQQHLRLGGQRTGDADALLLAAGQFRGIAVALVGEADHREQRLDDPGDLRAGVPAISSGSAMLSNAVRDDSRLKCWKIMPIERRAWRKARSSSEPIVEAIDET